jgi:hypothetical protein
LTILNHNFRYPFIPFCSTKWEEMMSQDVKQFDCSSQSHDYNRRVTSGWSVPFESDEDLQEWAAREWSVLAVITETLSEIL